jgi:hypothetical protein
VHFDSPKLDLIAKKLSILHNHESDFFELCPRKKIPNFRGFLSRLVAIAILGRNLIEQVSLNIKDQFFRWLICEFHFNEEASRKFDGTD